MNARIQELIDQATEIVEMVGPQGYASSYANFNRERFAEAIVQDCIWKIMLRKEEAIDNDWHVDEAMSAAISDIAEHFGVEE